MNAPLTSADILLKIIYTSVPPSNNYYLNLGQALNDVIMSNQTHSIDQVLVSLDFKVLKPEVSAFFLSKTRQLTRLIHWSAAKQRFIKEMIELGLDPKILAPDIF